MGLVSKGLARQAFPEAVMPLQGMASAMARRQLHERCRSFPMPLQRPPSRSAIVCLAGARSALFKAASSSLVPPTYVLQNFVERRPTVLLSRHHHALVVRRRQNQRPLLKAQASAEQSEEGAEWDEEYEEEEEYDEEELDEDAEADGAPISSWVAMSVDEALGNPPGAGALGPVGRLPLVAIALLLLGGLAAAIRAWVMKPRYAENEYVSPFPPAPEGFGTGGAITSKRDKANDFRIFRVGFSMDKSWPPLESRWGPQWVPEMNLGRQTVEDAEIGTESAVVEPNGAALAASVAAVMEGQGLPEAINGSVASHEKEEIVIPAEEVRAEEVPVLTNAAVEEVEKAEEPQVVSPTTALATLVEAELAEVVQRHKEEVEAIRAAAELEVSLLKQEQEQARKGNSALEAEVSELQNQLRVVKEITEHLFTADGRRDVEAEYLRETNARIGAYFEEMLEEKEAAHQEELAALRESLEKSLACENAEKASLATSVRDEAAKKLELRSALEARNAELMALEQQLKETEARLAATSEELRKARAESQALSAT
eukprot:TRINITY_DN2116_c0_g1_i1.p1 TRINITY_DN2116_c0_g1~~TRINITY_DN2116_c0_g1_i1.p1  ORF type:complete len:544 (+),score=143.51 TRINITY_DN2116_c0_g1_i1:219-1850(+)